MTKQKWFPGVALILLGSFVLLNALDKPRIAAAGLHGSDILRLVASGFGFGVGFAMLTVGLWNRRH